jgi:hypothetical protein
MFFTRFIFLLCANNFKQFIINNDIPICKDCVFYKYPISNGDKIQYGKCMKFGTKDIFSGDIYHSTDEEKCGFAGKYFEKNNIYNSKKN